MQASAVTLLSLTIYYHSAALPLRFCKIRNSKFEIRNSIGPSLKSVDGDISASSGHRPYGNNLAVVVAAFYKTGAHFINGYDLEF